MTDMRIEHLEDEQLPAARRLVWRVFRWQTIAERFSFWAIANRRFRLVRRLMAWHGVADFLDLWVAIDGETGALVGTTGLYVCTHDAEEAVWLAWFCVAPEARRRGIGSRLLDFSIDQARRTGRQYLRLYTSNRRNEAAAQILYESRGLKIVRKKRRLFYTTIYRELALDPAATWKTAEKVDGGSEIE
jgi:GNAT superfamily N-acetyltransferase